MGGQADVRSIESLKDFRASLALYAEEALGAVAAVDMEAKRSLRWLQHDRRAYWPEQVKRAREAVSAARTELSRRRMMARPGQPVSDSEQKEILRAAEARLRLCESKVVLLRKWEPALAQAILEYRASTRRIAHLAGGDVPRALALLERIVDALEAYLREPVPTSTASAPSFEAVAAAIVAAEPEPEPEPEPGPGPIDEADLLPIEPEEG